MTQITIASSSTTPVVIGSTSQNYVTVTGSGTINASGSYAVYAPVTVQATLVNSGRLSATNGYAVRFAGGGVVTNGSATDKQASIAGGSYGIRFDVGAGTVTNYGTISAGLTSKVQASGVVLGGNGVVINGSTADTSATISGIGNGIRAVGTAVSIANFGSILASGLTSYGIYLRSGGSVTNGSAADTSALIRGYELGIQTTTDGATIANFGTIQATSTLQSFGRAVHLSAGGTVINGSNADTVASLTGAEGGVYIKGPSNHGTAGISPSTVVNYGTITGNNNSGVYIRLGQNAVVINGSATDTAARIDGAAIGVLIQGFTPASITNFGTITGAGSDGVYLTGGGIITNGATNDTTALIQGTLGIGAGGATRATVVNFGTVSSDTGSVQAVRLTAGGAVTNGSSTTVKALLSGGVLILAGTGTVTNFGTIKGNIGVSFYRGLNKSITQTGSGTVVNFGTIESTSGSSGTAIKFGYGNERLVVNPGSSLVGKVVGGSGSNTMELASGAAGSSIGSIGTAFTNFRTLVVDGGASWTLTGSNSLVGGSATLSGGATLDVTGNLTASSLTMSGSGNLLSLPGPSNLSASIGGFGSGDTIDITGGTVTGLSFYGSVLTISNSKGVMGTLKFSGGGLNSANFGMKADGRGGTSIVAVGLAGSVAAVSSVLGVDVRFGVSFLAKQEAILVHPSNPSPVSIGAGSALYQRDAFAMTTPVSSGLHGLPMMR